ncbi:superinfection exclusion B family protein [Desulfuromonas soudanensis]|nr:superinfection exclusion B family protein [Desulfuromonas soudanensis]
MPDWIEKIVTFIRLPIKYMWVAVVFTCITLFAPDNWLSNLGLTKLKTEYRTWLGSVLIVSASLVFVRIVSIFWSKIVKFCSKRKLKAYLIESLTQLDPSEKSILREFYIQDKKTIQLPMDQATVSGLIQKSFLLLAGSVGERSLAGMLIPIKINPLISEHITYQTIDLPAEPTESDFDWLRDNRPEFLYEIEHHQQLFHTHWNRSRL